MTTVAELVSIKEIADDLHEMQYQLNERIKMLQSNGVRVSVTITNPEDDYTEPEKTSVFLNRGGLINISLLTEL